MKASEEVLAMIALFAPYAENTNAARLLFRRIEALERVAEAAMALIGDLPRNAIEYDSLKAELIKRIDALEPKR